MGVKTVCRRIGWMIVTAAVAVALAVAASRIPPSEWTAFGTRAVETVVGLAHPQESLQYMEQLVRSEATAVPMQNEADASVWETPAVAVPSRGEGGDIRETVISGTQTDGVSIKNNSGVPVDVPALLSKGVPLTPSEGTQPRVLIVHTHGCECYMSYDAGFYNHTDPTRSEDPAENVTAVGEAIAEELRAGGVGVLHDTTLHDSPEYTGAYNRSEKTVQAYLAAYPSIEVVLDIHRDAMMQADGTKLKPTVTVQGHKAAQVMAVIGGTDTPERPNPYCEDNLRLALAFHQMMERAYPSIMRPVYVVDARYNQGLKSGSMLLEIGTDANTLSEAVFSGRLVGKQLANLMT